MKLCARENPVNVLLRPLQVAGPQKYGNRPIQHDGERQGVVHAGGVFDSHVRALSGLSRTTLKPEGPCQDRTSQNHAVEAEIRSEERRVGKEWVSKCRYGGAPYH